MENKLDKKPDIRPDYIDVQLHKEDLAGLIDLLDQTVEYYLKIGAEMLISGDKNSHTIITSKAKMINAFNDKFRSYLLVGEPTSRDIH